MYIPILSSFSTRSGERAFAVATRERREERRCERQEERGEGTGSVSLALCIAALRDRLNDTHRPIDRIAHHTNASLIWGS